MKLKMTTAFAFFGGLLLAFSSCAESASKSKDTSPLVTESAQEVEKPENLQEYATAYFAAGCFWCVEAIYESVEGVVEAESGFAGGSEDNPNYRDVAYGRTGHAETVKVYYDPSKVSFLQLVQVFFGSHDPTTLNRQGPDKGPQYRSIAFYQNEAEQKIIVDYLTLLKEQQVYDKPIVTEVSPFKKFYIADEYHQDFERRNPNQSYVRAVSIPRLNRFKANFPDLLKSSAKSSH
jgi:peptide-methionine (S)-S-oxide reductase